MRTENPCNQKSYNKSKQKRNSLFDRVYCCFVLDRSTDQIAERYHFHVCSIFFDFFFIFIHYHAMPFWLVRTEDVIFSFVLFRWCNMQWIQWCEQKISTEEAKSNRILKWKHFKRPKYKAHTTHSVYCVHIFSIHSEWNKQNVVCSSQCENGERKGKERKTSSHSRNEQ